MTEGELQDLIDAGPRVDSPEAGLALAYELVAQCAREQADTLDLGGLQLTAIPDDLATQIGQLSQLKTIYLGGDAASRKSPYFGYQNRTKKCNALGALPGALFTALTQLETLDLALNRLEGLPSTFSNLTALTSLNLWGNEIGDDGARHLAGLTALTSLNLNGNRIGPDGARHLAGLTAFTSLDLEYNNIGADGARHLAGLTALTSLNLNGNRIGPDGARHLAGLTALTSLNLNGNRIGPDGARYLAGLTALTSLDLNGNRIGADGARYLAGLTALTSLNLNGNDIGPDGARHLAGLTALTSLNLNGNDIGPDGARHLAGLTALTRLDLNDNRIGADGARYLAGLTALTSLNLNGNEIGPDGARYLAGLTALTDLNLGGFLDLSNNDIGADGAQYLAGLTALTSLNLNDNRIGADGARYLAGLTALTSLNLNGNEIGPDGARYLAGLTALTSLNLNGNEIGPDGARHLAGLTALTDLNLGGNEIGPDGARHLAGLTALTSLDLGDNEIGDISPLSTLISLKKITLDDNQIETVSPDFWRLKTLEEVQFQDGKLADAPPEILSQSFFDNCLARIRAWLDAIERGQPVELRDVKCMILGNGQIGKTQMRRQLSGEKYDATIRTTHGIEIEETHFSMGRASQIELVKDTPPKKKGFFSFGKSKAPEKDETPDRELIPLKIWDFGGQDIYLGTHALFMRSRAVFPLLWTPTSEDNKTHIVEGFESRNYPLDYWLRYIRQMGGDRSPVLLVQSQCDLPELEQSPPVDPELRDSFVFRPKEIAYSAYKKLGEPALEDGIRQAVDFLNRQRGAVRIGESWAAAKIAIERLQLLDQKLDVEQRRNRTMSKTDYLQLCKDEGPIESEDEAIILLEYLHDLGVVFYKEYSFDGLIIIDQQWALNAIYAVFDRTSQTSQAIRHHQGRFLLSELSDRVWRNRFSSTEQASIIGMMQSCDICFVVRATSDADGEALYIAPDLLPEREDFHDSRADEWDDSEDILTSTFSFELLPSGLIRKVMAEAGERLGQHAAYWRTGFAFRDGETGAEARLESLLDDPMGWTGHIRLNTRGGRAVDLHETLVELVEGAYKAIGITANDVAHPASLRDVPDARASTREDNATDTAPAANISADLSGNENECFVSYAWGDETDTGQIRAQAFDAVCHRLSTLGIKPEFDKELLPYGQRITAFMDNMVETKRKAVVIISEKYLKSTFCMYELLMLWRESRSKPAIFLQLVRAVTLPDAQIWTLADRVSKAKYWRERLEEYSAIIKESPQDVSEEDFSDYKHMQAFALEVPNLLRLIIDTLHPTKVDDIDRLVF